MAKDSPLSPESDVGCLGGGGGGEERERVEMHRCACTQHHTSRLDCINLVHNDSLKLHYVH